MAVAAIVGEYGGSEDQMVAALLHDVVEEGDGLATLGEVRAQFGDVIAEWVRLCSDAFARPKPPWPDRKRAFIDTVRSTPAEVRLIVAADKLHNARSIVADRAATGEAVWERFTGKRDGTLWYYEEIRSALGDGWDHPILGELDSIIRALKSQVR
jgi:(p)ppGpp synthase/HD superfamily hydrolase